MCNFTYALENNLNTEDIVLLSYLCLTADTENLGDKFIFQYQRIIDDLPIIFNYSSYKGNTVKLRRMLDKEGMKNFVTGELKREGCIVGTLVQFNLNRENIKKLNIENVVTISE